MRVILISLLFATAPAFAGAASANDAIKAVFSKIDSCLAKGDAQCIGALFAEDGTYAGPLDRGEIVKGRSAIVKAFDGVVKGRSVKQTRKVEKIRMIGDDFAFVDCSVSVAGDKPVSEGGSGQVWHNSGLLKRDGGKWLLKDMRYYAVVVAQQPTPVPFNPTPRPSPRPRMRAHPARRRVSRLAPRVRRRRSPRNRARDHPGERGRQGGRAPLFTGAASLPEPRHCEQPSASGEGHR
jgi:uncharacterized protein (TIGR02246 family)